MKVLQINSVCGIRSTGRICTDIADVLTANGHECKIVYGRETVPEKYKKYAVRIGSNTDVKLHVLESRLFDNSGFGSKKATNDFIKWVKEYDPDVIHLHNIHGYYINIEILFNYLKSCNKRIIWTLHDCWPFTGHCSYFTIVKCEQWKAHCSYCVQKRCYPSSILADHCKSNFERKRALFSGIKDMTLITPSKWLADLVSESFLKKYPVKVIHNGIDLSVFKPTESDLRKKYGLTDKKVILGVASVWDERKGLDDFIKLSDLLDRQYQIVLIGLSDRQLKKIPDNVIGIKRTDSVTELAQWYTTADVFLNLTYEDNYPTVNLEAQACGTPCITYRTGGSVESVPEENIVDAGDILTIKSMLTNSQLSIAANDLSLNTAIGDYISVY